MIYAGTRTTVTFHENRAEIREIPIYIPETEEEREAMRKGAIRGLKLTLGLYACVAAFVGIVGIACGGF